MATRLRTDPISNDNHPEGDNSNMAVTSSSSGRPRPQIYVHFEFGVSWSQRHAPKPHTMTYMSRNMRERSHAHHHFPRHVPPPNTNFLTGGGPTPLHHHHHQQSRSVAVVPVLEPTQEQERERERPRERQSPPQQERRHSRQSSRSSHERGRSAPPPFNDSPWDADPEPMSASVLPSPQSQSNVWKDLPAAPSQFRLGEDGMPWQAWTWPGGYHEEYYDDHSNAPVGGRYGSNEAGPSAISTYSPDRGRHDFDGRRRELEALSAAMMTIDNGFEDQWWFQGPREQMGGDLHRSASTSAAERESHAVQAAGSVGWAVAREEERRDRASMAMVVSPVTEFGTPLTDYGSPPPSYATAHPTRTMTARSDELFLPL